MTGAGWLIMLISVGGVVTLFVWCLWRVFTIDPKDTVEHLHGELNIDTHEQD